MNKKIQIIVFISIILMLTNFVGISTANNPLNNQSFVTLGYFPQSYDFGDIEKGEVNSTTFEIWNAGCCTLHYELYENEEWIKVEPTSGSSIGEHNIITVTINTINLTVGYHESNINIITNDITANFTVTVHVIFNNLINITVDEAWILLNDTSNGIQSL